MALAGFRTEMIPRIVYRARWTRWKYMLPAFVLVLLSGEALRLGFVTLFPDLLPAFLSVAPTGWINETVAWSLLIIGGLVFLFSLGVFLFLLFRGAVKRIIASKAHLHVFYNGITARADRYRLIDIRAAARKEIQKGAHQEALVLSIEQDGEAKDITLVLSAGDVDELILRDVAAKIMAHVERHRTEVAEAAPIGNSRNNVGPSDDKAQSAPDAGPDNHQTEMPRA